MTPLEYGRTLQSKTTSFIHVGDTIPTLYNLLFVYTLFQQKTVEDSQEAKRILDKIFGFLTPDKRLPRNLHEYPQGAHDSHYADILFVLNKLKRYATIPQLASAHELPRAKQALLDNTPFTPTDEWEWKYALLIDPKMTCPSWDRRYLRSIDGAKWEGTDPVPTFLDYVMQKRRGNDVAFADPDYLFIPLLLAVGTDVTYTSDEHLIQTKDRTKQLVDLPECSLFCVARKGEFTKEGNYKSLEVHPNDFDLTELTCYFPVMDGNSLLVNGEKQTTFTLGDTLQLHSKTGVLVLSFTQIEGGGQWMGHIGRGDRPGQTVVSTKTDFVHFDYTITLRSMKRSDESTLAINWDYVEKAGESTEAPIACSPLST